MGIRLSHSGRVPSSRSFHRIKDHAASVVSDEAFTQRAERWPVDTPDTKEAYFIREIFEGTARSHRS